MAKFKVGDKVFCRGFGSKPMRVAEVIEISPSQVDYILAGNPNVRHGEPALTAANSRCVNSTRPIVQNALERKAYNRVVDQDGDEIRVGHDVMRAYSSDGLQMTVTKIEGNKVYFKDPSKGICWDMAEDLIAMNKSNSAPDFNNPYYRAEDGIEFLASDFDLFSKVAAKWMIADAKKKGVKIPASLVAKAKKAGIWNSAPDDGEAKNAEVVGNASAADYKKAADEMKKYANDFKALLPKFEKFQSLAKGAVMDAPDTATMRLVDDAHSTLHTWVWKLANEIF